MSSKHYQTREMKPEPEEVPVLPAKRWRMKRDRSAKFLGRRYRPLEVVDCYDMLDDEQKKDCEEWQP